MKLQTTHKREGNIEGLETKQFSIKVNAKAFSTLLDSLYTNKIQAVIRELWTNAFDSHIEAGISDRPFDCHLPSKYNRSFSVRDYGVSLTHDQVMNLYTTLFDSTKDESNDYVGALGLGSKSPFAYTDSFIVTAILDSEKRVYIANLDDSGTPTISLQSQEFTDEEQGLEVSLAVRNGDDEEFLAEARRLAIGFNPLPNVDGIQIDTVDPIFVNKEGSVAVMQSQAFNSSAQLFIRQGCVIYPVSNFELCKPLTNLLIGYGVNAKQMVIDVPMGAVSITASRESLSLDEKTVEYVKNALNQAIEDITKEVIEEANKCTNLLEAKKFWFLSQDSNRSYSQIFRIPAIYKDEQIDQYVKLKGGSNWEVPLFRGKSTKFSAASPIHVDRLKKVKIITSYDDKPVPRHIMRFKAEREKGPEEVWLIQNPTPRQIERIYTLLGLTKEQIVWVGNLPDVEHAPKNMGTIQGVYHCNMTGNYPFSKADEIPTTDYWWFSLEKNTVANLEPIKEMINSAKILGIIKTPYPAFISVTEKAAKKYDLPEDKNLPKIISDAVSKVQDEWEEKLKLNFCKEFSNNMEHTEHLMGSVLEPFGWQGQHAAKTLLPADAVKRARTDAEEIYESMKIRYPLLFEPVDRDTIMWYIEARNKELDNK